MRRWLIRSSRACERSNGRLGPATATASVSWQCLRPGDCTAIISLRGQRRTPRSMSGRTEAASGAYPSRCFRRPRVDDGALAGDLRLCGACRRRYMAPWSAAVNAWEVVSWMGALSRRASRAVSRNFRTGYFGYSFLAGEYALPCNLSQSKQERQRELRCLLCSFYWLCSGRSSCPWALM